MRTEWVAAGLGLIMAGWCGAAVPVGLDAYREWARWPEQRIGVRTYMRSTYDRRGGNESADASHYLYQEREDFNVAMDVEGPGFLYFVRTNHWHGSPWHYEVDGVDRVVTESSTADPTKPVEGSTFLPADVFAPPLAWTWSVTKGADLNWVPIGFEKSLRLAYGRTHYGTGYYIYQQYCGGTELSSPVTAFDFKTAPPADVVSLINQSGADIAPKDIATERSDVTLVPGEAREVATLKGAGVVRALKLSVSRDRALDVSDAWLRITWDGRGEASVDVPLSLFFGAGVLYNRDGREWLVKSFPMGIRYEGERVELSCYFPMPFFREARVELVGDKKSAGAVVTAEVRHEAFGGRPEEVGYFHATYKDHGVPLRGKDLVLLNTKGIEGAGEWSGSFVGTSFVFTDRGTLTTLEGDPRFFFDDSESPQAQGTGTEEWGGGGDYWGGRTMTLPFAGHPTGARTVAEAKGPEDLVHSAYRFLLADLFPFGKNARIQLEHGGTNDSTEHYRTVTYWYGLPAASLVKTDQLDIGDEASESGHAYRAAGAVGGVKELSSRYELGPDAIGGKEVYPEHVEHVRYTKGETEFELKLAPENEGVMLRRTLDYGVADQRAEVWVSDAAGEPKWERAGVWYTAGSNTCYHSNPKTETGRSMPVVQTSNRRFRDEEFLVPKDLTHGRERVRVKVKFTPINWPLLPGGEVGERSWSEIRYAAYCWVRPKFEVGKQ